MPRGMREKSRPTKGTREPETDTTLVENLLILLISYIDLVGGVFHVEHPLY